MAAKAVATRPARFWEGGGWCWVGSRPLEVRRSDHCRLAGRGGGHDGLPACERGAGHTMGQGACCTFATLQSHYSPP